MSIHTVKRVSELVPGTAGMIKRASLEQNMPTGSREETLISALELEYMMKVAHTGIDLEAAERVCKAVDLYGLRDEVKSHTESMVKAASAEAAGKQELKHEVERAEEFIQSQLTTMQPDIEKIAEASERLWDEYSEHITSDEVRIYSGAGTLVKEAAVLALNHRAKRTGNKDFTKVAQVIEATDTNTLSVEDNRAIISAVSGLEKAAHYMESDLYTDMFMAKEASCQINLGSKSVPAESLIKVAETAGDILGEDIGQLLKSADVNKSAIEALPMGELQALAGLV